MRERIWRQTQLFTALWVIPAGPAAVVLSVATAADWPVWSFAALPLAVTWPVAWYIWLMGDDNAVPR